MLKPNSLRDALTKASAYLKQNPECLHIFVDAGNVVATLAASLSWEYRYTLNVIITDFAGDQNLLIAPIVHWLRKNQPDLFANNTLRETGFSFEVDIFNHTTCDISIELKLTERVIVKKVDGNDVVQAVPEPLDPDDWPSHE